MDGRGNRNNEFVERFRDKVFMHGNLRLFMRHSRDMQQVLQMRPADDTVEATIMFPSLEVGKQKVVL